MDTLVKPKSKTTEVTLPKGKYYIGDLCHVIKDDDVWSELCKLTFNNGSPLQGKFKLSDGREFVLFRTYIGDGVYDVEYRGVHVGYVPVDSGTIGAILVKDVGEEIFAESYVSHFFADLEEGTVCSVDEKGSMSFGHYKIDT